MMAKTSDFEKFKTCLTEIGVPFTTTDDSSESGMEEKLDTVIVIQTQGDEQFVPPKRLREMYIFFTQEGRYKKEIDVV